MSFFAELKRRNVVRVGIAYVVASWLIAQVAELAADSFGAPDWFMRMLLTILALGLPIALIFAWAFEMTPEGLKREHEVDRSQSITPQTGRKLDFMIIAVLVVALAYFVADKFLLQPAAQQAAVEQAAAVKAEAGPRSIAVLPLVNMSADAENEYFSDGLTEELLNILAKIKELQVAGRTSSFAFKGQHEDLRGIAEKLNVESILEGSVRKDDQRVRITLQLINAENGYHLWSETYDRDLDDIFAIQEEVAREVAQALKVTLLGDDEARLAHQPTTDMSAYDHYLQGLQQWTNFSYASLEQARASFSSAIELDPDYLPAQVRLAAVWASLAQTGAISRSEAVEQATPILRHVLATDPDDDLAHAVMANVHRLAQRPDDQRREALRALEINPRNTYALGQLARYHKNVGEVTRGMEFLLEAERIDPYAPGLLFALAFAHGEMLQTDKALEYAERIGEINPDSPNYTWAAGVAYLIAGNLAQSLERQYKTHELDPNDYEISGGIAGLWLDLGDMEQAEYWLQVADQTGADQPIPIKTRIQLLQYREQYELAAELAKQALDRKLDGRQGSENTIRNAWVGELYRKGRIDEALTYYKAEHPGAFAIPPEYDVQSTSDTLPMIEIAVLLRALDPKSEQADGFLAAAQHKLDLADEGYRPHFTALDRGGLEAARGNKDAAIEYLQQAVDLGLRVDWRDGFQEWFVLKDLQDEPEFKRLIAQIEADMDHQRELAYKLVGTGP